MSLTLERLARRLDATPDEVHDALRRLRAELTDSDAQPLAPIGSFRVEDGTLHFEPAPSLEELVNERFAGLEAITLPSGGTSFSKKEHVSADTPAATPREEAPDAAGPPSEAERPDAALPSRDAEASPPPRPNRQEVQDASPHSTRRTAPQAGGATMESPSLAERLAAFSSALHPPADPTESQLVGATLAPLSSPDASSPSSPSDPSPPDAARSTESVPSAEGPAASPDRASAPPTRSAERRASRTVMADEEAAGANWGLVLAALAVLALMAFGAWFFLLSGDDDAPASPEVADTRSADASSPAATEDDAADAAGTVATDEAGAGSADTAPSGDDAATGDAAQEQPAEEPPASQQTGISWTPGSWTIVVASEPDRPTAETLIERYRDDLGALSPIGMLPDVSERYRVGVGQFDTLDDLRAALDQYSDRLPDGAWPLQIEATQ